MALKCFIIIIFMIAACKKERIMQDEEKTKAGLFIGSGANTSVVICGTVWWIEDGSQYINFDSGKYTITYSSHLINRKTQ